MIPLSNKRIVLAALLGLISLSCEHEEEMVNPSTPGVFIETHNLQPLAAGEGHYEAWVSFADPQAPPPPPGQIVDTSFVSLGQFNVDGNGHLTGPDGKTFTPSFAKRRNTQYMVDALITIRREGDTSVTPGHAFLGGIVTGDLRTAFIDLSTGYREALGSDFRNVGGSFLNDTPTDAEVPSRGTGFWFMKSVAPDSAGLVNLPKLNEGWKYEGWVKSAPLCVPCPAVRISTGKFLTPTGADEDSAGPERGTNGNGYNFPGEDFISSGGFPSMWAYTVMITIEPDPDNSPLPFSSLRILEFSGTVSGERRVPYAMANAAAEMATAKITILR